MWSSVTCSVSFIRIIKILAIRVAIIKTIWYGRVCFYLRLKVFICFRIHPSILRLQLFNPILCVLSWYRYLFDALFLQIKQITLLLPMFATLLQRTINEFALQCSRWSVESVHTKNIVSILHLLVALARHFRWVQQTLMFKTAISPLHSSSRPIGR